MNNQNDNSMEHTEGKGQKANTDNSNAAEGAKYKGNPDAERGSHQEGQYDKQDDDATMQPSSNEENA